MNNLIAVILFAFIQPKTVRDPRVPVNTIVGNDGMVTYIMRDGSWKKASMRKTTPHPITLPKPTAKNVVKPIEKKVRREKPKPRYIYTSRKSKTQNEIEERAFNSKHYIREITIQHNANTGKDTEL